MALQLVKNIRENPMLRKSFFHLAQQTFDLDFAPWYRRGFWTDMYRPYAFAEGDTVAANASINHIHTLWQGAPRHYIQIGTVMTAPAYRGRGLSRRLLEEILSDWQGKCDCIYLYANDSVLDFYPKFGFAPAAEYQYSCTVSPCPGDFAPLDMDVPEHQALLRRCYEMSNPYAALPVRGNFGLLMFYCGGPMRSCVWYSPALDTVCIAEQTGGILSCLDIFGPGSVPLESLLANLVRGAACQAHLGFTPKNTAGFDCAKIKTEDETLFLLKEGENLFAENKLMFPILSHA